MGRRKTMSKKYIWQTKCPWTNEETSGTSIQWSFSAIQRNELRQQHGWPSRPLWWVQKPDQNSTEFFYFLWNSRENLSLCSCKKADGDLSQDWLQKETFWRGRRWRSCLEGVIGTPGVQLCTVPISSAEVVTQVYTYLFETHKSVHLKCVHYRTS